MNEFELRYFQLENGKKPFMDWFDTLDKSIKKRVLTRLDRIQQGNFGDYKKIDDILYELRLDYGKGYRIYYMVEKIQ